MNKMLQISFVLFCILLALSCKKDDSNPLGPGTSVTNNTITGQIDNWTGGTGKTIRPVHGDPGNSNYAWLPSSPITADGKFSIELGTPPDSMLVPITQDMPPGVNISDPTAKVGAKIEEFVVSPGGGSVYRVSSTTYTFFGYSDKNVRITGSAAGRTYSLNFVKGWNRYTIPKSGSGSVSSTEPADTKWVYVP